MPERKPGRVRKKRDFSVRYRIRYVHIRTDTPTDITELKYHKNKGVNKMALNVYI